MLVIVCDNLLELFNGTIEPAKRTWEIASMMEKQMIEAGLTTEEIQKRDEKLIKTESLVKRIINKYKELGYTEVRAYECLEEVIQDMKTSRGIDTNDSNKISFDTDKDNKNIDLMLSINHS